MHGKGAFYRERHWEPGGNGSAYLRGARSGGVGYLEKEQTLGLNWTEPSKDAP